MKNHPRVVALGGGHGLYASLSALRRITDNLTAVVTVADDGGSSGRLREEFDILPPGDLRMALAALCSDNALGRRWAEVLQSRFTGTGPLAGHAIGNLLIAGLWQCLDDSVAGLDMVAQLLGVQGRVLPMAAVPLNIKAEVYGINPELPDEPVVISGQAKVAKTPGRVEKVWLEPQAPPARTETLASIAAADYIILGPGSWFTSVLPHLLVPQLADAIIAAQAQKILVLNLDSALETDGFSAADHIALLAEHAPKLRIDYVIADPSYLQDRNTGGTLASYVSSLGAKLIVAPVRNSNGSATHDPFRLAAVFSDIMDRS